jgi:hypothetical protein
MATGAPPWNGISSTGMRDPVFPFHLKQYLYNTPLPTSLMEKIPDWDALPGTTAADKLVTLGIEKRRILDIRLLEEISSIYHVPVYLFFEEDLARTRTLESVQQEYGAVPEYERPFILLESFLTFTRENDPSFEQTMREFPLTVEIVNIGETAPAGNGRPLPYVTGLMPFLDELDVDSDLPLQ